MFSVFKKAKAYDKLCEMLTDGLCNYEKCDKEKLPEHPEYYRGFRTACRRILVFLRFEMWNKRKFKKDFRKWLKQWKEGMYIRARGEDDE